MTELALLQRWTDKRDAQAFKEIVSRYAPMVYATCKRILGNPTEAEDLTQECFELLARAQKGPTEHLGAWLHRVATNRALDSARSDLRRKAREERFALEHDAHIESEWNDLYEIIDEAISELPDDLRVPVVAYFLQDESHAKIARATGVPRRTISRRIAQAVESIGVALRKRGVTVSSGALASLMGANLAEAAEIPAGLAAALGRLALAHSVNATIPAVSSWMVAGKLIGGLLIMKKIIAGLVLVGAALTGLWIVTKSEPQPPVELRQETAPAKTAEAVAGPVPAPKDIAVEANRAEGEGEAAKAVAEVPHPGIFGKVVDAETGEGITDATVWALDAAAEDRSGMHQATSSQDGQFEFTGLPGGAYLVYKDSGPGDYTGSLTDDIIDVRLRDDERKEDILLLARKGGTISGLVTDERGKPIANATLTLQSAATVPVQGIKANRGSWFTGTAQSDDTGRYTIRGMTLNRNSMVTANAVGYAPARSAEFSLPAPGSSQQVDFCLSRGSSIAGWVRDRNGEPKSHTEIALFPEIDHDNLAGYRLMCEASGRTEKLQSGENGEFRIEGLPAGTYHLFAGGLLPSRALPFGGGGTPVKVDGLANVEDVVVLADSSGMGDHFIAGRVSNAEDEPIAGAALNVHSMNTFETFQVVSDADGAFLATGVGPGPFLCSVTAAGYSQVILKSVPVDQEDLAIQLNRKGSVQGCVVDDLNGKPLAGVRVSIAEQDAGRGLDLHPIIFKGFESLRKQAASGEEDVSRADGAFELASVEPGGVVLKAEHSGYAVAFSQELSIEPDKETGPVVLRLSRGASVDGTVRTTSGTPVGGALILAVDSHRDEDRWWEADERLMRATSDGEGGKNVVAESAADGRFTIEALSDGAYWIRALASGYACSPALNLAVVHGKAPSSIELVVDPGGTIEGNVTENGAPKEGTRIEVSSIGGDSSAKVAYTDAKGHYLVEHVAPGEHLIRVVDMTRKNGVQNFSVVVVSGKTVRQDADYNGHAVYGVITGLPDPGQWAVAILSIPEGVNPEDPPDPSIDWPAFLVDGSPIQEYGRFWVESVPDGVYKLVVIQPENPTPGAQKAWETIQVDGKDLEFNVQATR